MKEPVTYPAEFLQRMKLLLNDEYPTFVESLDTPSSTSIRLNPNKPITKFDGDEKVPWCSNGRYLKERPSFTFDPLFHAGTYYVQEASSMLLEEVWKQINPENETVRVLDLCAAPGGKSTHLLSLMNEDSLLVSNELIPNRNRILQQNIIKWGNANCIITQNKAEDFSVYENHFDIILIDAPCSGEGLFRKDKEAIDEWNEKNVDTCSVRQKEIVQHAIKCLKPGGHLIYSTCTFEPVENDENVKWMKELGMSDGSLWIEQPGITKTKYGHQCYPHKIKGEGFYIAVLKKNRNIMQGILPKSQPNSSSPLFVQYLKRPDNFIEMKKNDMVFAIPKTILRDFTFLDRSLYIRNAGVLMGTIKGKDFLPSHDLAISNHIQQNLPKVELNYEQAIAYLRCETPKVNTEVRGWALATYENRNLGWMKILDNRWNNYFPKEWRILKR